MILIYLPIIGKFIRSDNFRVRYTFTVYIYSQFYVYGDLARAAAMLLESQARIHCIACLLWTDKVKILCSSYE